MELQMDPPLAYAAFDAALGARNTGPPVPYKGARPIAAENDTARECVGEGREVVGGEEQREESDGEQVGEEELREEDGDNEPEDDALSIHLPEEEEIESTSWPTTPPDLGGLQEKSERKIIQLMGATGTKCTGCGFEASNR